MTSCLYFPGRPVQSSKYRIARNHNDNTRLEHRPQHQPRVIWLNALTVRPRTNLHDSYRGEKYTHQTSAEQHSHSRLLQTWHLEIPSELHRQEKDCKTHTSSSPWSLFLRSDSPLLHGSRKLPPIGQSVTSSGPFSASYGDQRESISRSDWLRHSHHLFTCGEVVALS
jgi:hypothetical protein